MTSFLDTIYAVTVKTPQEGMVDLFLYLRSSLIGLGINPHSATVWVAAAPIIVASLIVKVMAWRKLCRLSSSTIETTTPATDAAPTSIHDDWADIADELKKENHHA